MQNRRTTATLLALLLCFFGTSLQASKFVSGTALVIVSSTVITKPGVYILGNDFVGTVTIDADNVTLDLNNRKISDAGISVVSTGHTDVTIRNGILENATQNHILATACTNLLIQDVDFVGSQTAIKLEGCDSALINDCTMRELTSQGILLLGSTCVTVDNCSIFNSDLQGGVRCFLSQNCNLNNIDINNNRTNNTDESDVILVELSENIITQRCQVHNNTNVSDAPLSCFVSANSRNLSFFACSAYENVAEVGANTLAGFLDFQSRSVEYDQCVTQTNLAVGVRSFICAASQALVYRQCSSLDEFAVALSTGFAIGVSSGVTVADCLVSRNLALAGAGCTGVLLNGSAACVVSNCLVESGTSNTSDVIGFDFNGTHTTLVVDCVAQHNLGGGDGIGFRLTNCTECSVRNNIAVGNQSTGGGTTNGFLIDSSGIGFLNNTIFSNQAQDHGVGANNFVVTTGAIPQVTFTQSTGTFSATPTAYDNISVITS